MDNTDALWLAWPPSAVPKNPIIWFRYSNGGFAWLDTGSLRLVPLFLTEEAAKVVARAIKKRLGIILEIREAIGISKSDFESGLRQSGELPLWNGEYRIIWEDDHLFIGLCYLLSISVGIKTGTTLSEETIRASIKEVMK